MSEFAMTQRHVASADATSISSSIRRGGGRSMLDGHKRWVSGAPEVL